MFFSKQAQNNLLIYKLIHVIASECEAIQSCNCYQLFWIAAVASLLRNDERLVFSKG